MTTSSSASLEQRPFPVQHSNPAPAASSALTIMDDRALVDNTQLVNLLPDCVAVVRQGRISYVNTAGTRLVGATTADQLIGRQIDELVLLDPATVVPCSAPLITELRRVDGTTESIEVVVMPLGDQQTADYLLVARKRSGLTLLEAEVAGTAIRASSSFSSAPDIIYVLDIQAHLPIFFNREEFCGYERDELLTLGTATHTVYNTDRPAVLAHYHEVTTTDDDRVRSIEYRLWRRNGSLEWVQCQAMVLTRTDAGEPHQVLFALTVITERKQAEMVRRVQDARSHVMVEDQVELICRFLPNGKLTFVNDAYEQYLGLPRTALVGQSVFTLIPESEHAALRQALTELDTTRPTAMAEQQMLLPDGRRRWQQIIIRAIFGDSGDVVMFQSVGRDITLRKQAELLDLDRIRIMELMIRDAPLEYILREIASLIGQMNPALRCSILMMRGGWLRHASALGVARHAVEIFDDTIAGPEGGPWGLAAHLGSNVLVDDLAHDQRWPHYHAVAASYDLRACWSAPIKTGSSVVLGVVTLYTATPGLPTRSDLDLLTMASQMAALAIDQHRLRERLAYQAQHDALTGLPNRYLFDDRLRQALAQADRSQTMVGLLLIDLDGFKKINDSLGHPVGDALLQEVARRLSSAVRQSDTMARMGGDEFAVVLTELHRPKDAVRVAHKLMATLNQPFLIGNRTLFVNASIGVSLFPQDGSDATTLIQHADTALYRAKAGGKHNVQFFAAEMTAHALERLELETALRMALERHELTLFYQPQFDLLQQTVSGVEALLRWDHAEFGRIMPDMFIPLAEESGLIVPIGTWVLHEACRQGAAWRRAGLPALRIAVNVSARQFAQDNFVAEVASALERSGMPPELLELEVTESAVMHDINTVSERLRLIRQMGVRVTIDDFGVGYSSLAYLRTLPVDGLKIDRSFIADLTAQAVSKKTSAAMVATIITLARALEVDVAAEGVETAAQLTQLYGQGCDRVQGYLFAPPLPHQELWSAIQTIQTGGEM